MEKKNLQRLEREAEKIKIKFLFINDATQREIIFPLAQQRSPD